MMGTNGNTGLSFLNCVNQLVDLNIISSLSKSYDVQAIPTRLQQKRLKQKIYDACFLSGIHAKYEAISLQQFLLNKEKWDLEIVLTAVLYRLRTAYRKFEESEKLHKLFETILADGKKVPVLKVLLCLADVCPTYDNSIMRREILSRTQKEELLTYDTVLQYGNTQNNLITKRFLNYPSWIFEYPGTVPLMPTANDNISTKSEYKACIPYLTHFDLPSITSKSNYSLKGLKSPVFSVKENLNDPFTCESQTTLYGGLVHSHASSTKISLSLPRINETNSLDICHNLINVNKFVEEDEGFVSRGSSPSPTTSHNSIFLSDLDTECMLPVCIDSHPYHGYRLPAYEVSGWSRAINLKKKYHRTWEKNGKSPGETFKCWYVTEAGHGIFDAIWKQRWQLVIELATALYTGTNNNKVVIVPSLYKWLEVDEKVLVRCAVLVTMGVTSAIFMLNTLAQMFLGSKKVHIHGVTPTSVHMLLSRFAEWGTCYWRLVRFSSAGLSIDVNQERGVIFKAFCDGIRTYLHRFQQNVLSYGEQHKTLQQLSLSFENMGSQISYLCHLCMCDGPDAPQKHFTSLVHPKFPSKVDILSYLYEEALHCTRTTDYLVLLYLLRKCCQPYLQFVQDTFFTILCCQLFFGKALTWVFRGTCWDISGEFFLRVNVECGQRRDRTRWTNYLQAVKPGDVRSCVPSFLTSVADDIMTCGKTVELLQLICPEHFLCTHLVSVPRIVMSFSATRMQELVYKWRQFETETHALKLKRMTLWQEKEDDLKRLKKESIFRARQFFEEQRQEEIELNQQILQETHKNKMLQLNVLKKQALEEIERKAQNKLKEKKDDANLIKEIAQKEAQAKLHEDQLLGEAKNELIAHYKKLTKEAEERKFRANWKIRRHQLRDKRIDYLTNEQKRTIDQVSTEYARTPAAESEDRAFLIEKSTQILPINMSNNAEDSTNTDHGLCTSLDSEIVVQTITQEPKIDLSKRKFVDHSVESTQLNDESNAVLLDLSSHTRNTVFHPSQQSKENSHIQFRKSVSGKHVSTSTIFSHGDLQDIQFRKSVSGKHVSTSTIFSHGGLQDINDLKSLSAKQSKKLDSNVNILSDWTQVQLDVLKPRSRIVDGNHISQSSVSQLFQTETEGKLIAPSYSNVKNTIGQHSSQSSVQELLYYGKYARDQKNQKPVNDTSSSHPSSSTVQLLLYPATITAPDKEDRDDEFNKFNLLLPPGDQYNDVFVSNFTKLKCKRNDVSVSHTIPVDLYRSLMGEFSGLYSDDDDIDDILGHLTIDGSDVTIDFYALPILMRNCVLRPIRAHAELVNSCVVNYFMADLDMPRHFETLRHFLLLEDGEFAETFSCKLFELVHSGCKPSIALNPVSLDAILSRAIQTSGRRNSPYARHLSVDIGPLPPAFTSTDLYVLDCIELRYVVEWPCNIVLTESCHLKYNRVLSFLLQLKHVMWSLHDACKLLNMIVDSRSSVTSLSFSEVRKLHIYRHEMNNFVKVMQGYVSTQVLHVCWQEFQESLRNDLHKLDDLHAHHNEYINRCVLRCLLAPKAQNVMNVICDALKCILKFRAQINTPASCKFPTLRRTYLEFTRFSNFLFRVVSKLVDRGYQPHLEDFLIRLNFNGYYKT